MTMPLRPGEQTRLGRYELLGRLGQGGMGTVYLGSDDSGRRVAIKMVRPEFADEQEFRGRFRSEVNRAKQVPPFSTAEVLDADPDHDPPYLVVEYVEGPSLQAVIADKGPLSGSALHGVAVGIATALTAIHGAGVIHRDLKPGNVLIAMGGIKVIDFGIARAFEATSAHTRTDQMVGTVAYMAPERFDDAGGRQVGPAADIFAWGAVVAYAATGRTPFAADSAASTAMRILTQPPELSGLPEPLRALVARALAKEPKDRPTARQLLDLLLAGGTGEAGVAALAQEATTVTPRPRRRQRLLLPVAVIVAVLAGMFGARIGMDRSDAGSEPAGDTPVVRPTPSVDPHAEILAGRNLTLLHVDEIDRDLALDVQDPRVRAADGTGNKSLFLLEPVGVDYLVRTLREGVGGPETCLGVRNDPEGSAFLVPAQCKATKATLFSFTAIGKKDDKGRERYTMSNDESGTVLWDPSNRTVIVEVADDWTPNLSVSFVDRGPLSEAAIPSASRPS
ncbi:serine/threonine-protein kinase [Winogradskya consettensis]|nr:serine/threonine-protein kinase [Actinoplanes consettensis]